MNNVYVRGPMEIGSPLVLSHACGAGEKPIVDLSGNDSIISIFIPHDDDSFACTSHECLAIIEVPNGTWLFSTPTET